MKTLVQTLKTTVGIALVLIGLVALFTIDNAQTITTLLIYGLVLVSSFSIGVALLISANRNYFDADDDVASTRDPLISQYEDDIEAFRKDNIRLRLNVARLRGIIINNDLDLTTLGEKDYDFVYNKLKNNALGK